MKVVAFYSFKGGVGRTNCLLSVAYTLARRGRKVLVADWDLHAPGLSLMQCMQPARSGPTRTGILEYLAALHPDRGTGQPSPIEDLLVSPQLMDEAREQKTADGGPHMRGDLWFIPAGDLNRGVDEFIKAVHLADLHDLSHFVVNDDPDNDPRLVFKLFCYQVQHATIPWHGEGLTGEPDYLLVDCRTGLTEIGDLLLGDATDFTVIVYGQNDQNFDGLRIVLNASPRHLGDLIANTMLIWSGSVPGQEAHKVQQKRRKEQLIRDVCQLDSFGLPEPFPDEFQFPHNPDLVVSLVPLVHSVPDGETAELFARITDKLEERCIWPEKLLEAVIVPFDPNNPVPPEQRQLLIATTSPQAKQAKLQDAWTQIELACGLAPLLFNPPPWNLAGISTLHLVAQWPEGIALEERELVLKLVGYSISLPTQVKLDMVVQGIGKLTAVQVRERIAILARERHELLTSTPQKYWGAIARRVTAAFEWLAALAQLQPQSQPGIGAAPPQAAPPSTEPNPFDSALRRMIQGEQLPSLGKRVRHPFFQLLVSEVLTTAGEQGEGFLRQWLANHGLDPLKACIALLDLACKQVDTQAERRISSPAVRGDLLARYGAALAVHGDATPAVERVAGLDRAIATFAQSLALRPDNAVTLHNLGAVFGKRGQASPPAERMVWFDRAIESCEQSLALRPDDADTLNNLGAVLSERGRVSSGAEQLEWFDRAIAMCARSLVLRPEHAGTLANQGAALANRGQASPEGERAAWFDRAIATLERALAPRPKRPDTSNNLGAALGGRAPFFPGPERAAWYFQAALSLNWSLAPRPEDADTLNKLGAALLDRGRASPAVERAGWFDRAIATFERSLALRPDAVDTLNNLVGMLLNRWRLSSDAPSRHQLLEKAAAAAEKTMALDPRKGRYNLACLLALRGEKERSLAELWQAITDDPHLREQAARDEDLESLAGNPDFQKLIGGRSENHVSQGQPS